jgi:hypothetical protein
MSDGPWEMSGPEEGDTIDETVIICNADHENYEIIEISAGTLGERKALARKIVNLLNQSQAELMI